MLIMRQDRIATKTGAEQRTHTPGPKVGTAFVNPSSLTTPGSLTPRSTTTRGRRRRRPLTGAVAWFATEGWSWSESSSTTDSFVAHLWRDTCAELATTRKRTPTRRPQTNGKIERIHSTPPDGWAFQKFYNSESARSAALPAWVHHYNLQRPHTANRPEAPKSPLDQTHRSYT